MKNIVFISAVLLLSIIAEAQEDTVKINEVIIKDSIHFNPNVLTPEKDINIKSTGELMQQLPGISISKRSSFSIEPVINAFKYDQINTAINGTVSASSSCPNRMDPITTRIAPDNIQKIEVVKGPYEVKYGEIMGGYINLMTYKKPTYNKFTIGGNLSSEYNFNGNGTVNSANLKGGNKHFDFNLGANYRKFENYKSGDGTEISSSYETYGFDAGLGINISSKQRIFLNYLYSKANDVMHAGLPMDADFDESNMLSLDYEIKSISQLLTHFKLNVYAAAEDHLMSNANRPNSTVSLANTPVNSNNIGGRFELGLNPFKNAHAHIGGDFKRIAKDGNKEVTIYKNICATPPSIFNPPLEKEFEVWQNSSRQDLGLFFDISYLFSEKLDIKVGLRGDYIQSEVLSPEQDFLKLYNNNIQPDDKINANYFVKLNYYLPANYKLQLSVGQGTRAPSLLEQYINHFTVGLDAYEYVGNPHLKSEINHQANLKLSKKHKNFGAYADIFISQIDNYITAVEDTNIIRKFTACKEPHYAKRFVNLDQVFQTGFNIGAQVNFLNYFNASIDLTYTYAENTSLNEPLQEIAPFTSLIRLNFKKKNWKASLQNEFQAQQTRVSDLVGEKESKAFTVFNINASYLFFKKLNIGFAVDNIFNVNYYRHLSRPYKNMDNYSMFYEPGTSVRVFAKYVF